MALCTTSGFVLCHRQVVAILAIILYFSLNKPKWVVPEIQLVMSLLDKKRLLQAEYELVPCRSTVRVATMLE